MVADIIAVLKSKLVSWVSWQLETSEVQTFKHGGRVSSLHTNGGAEARGKR